MSAFTVLLADMRERVESIKHVAASGDDERAHGQEDDLRHRFIEYVAVCAESAEMRGMAKLVLSTTDLEFGRYCA